MGNHFHILVKVIPEYNFADEDILKRHVGFYDDERIRRYRWYVYEAGSINQPAKGQVKVIEDKVLAKERSKEFELSKSNRFRYRTRYFTDSGIIGSKEFVSTNYQRFKNLFSSKHKKKRKNRPRNRNKNVQYRNEYGGRS